MQIFENQYLRFRTYCEIKIQYVNSQSYKQCYAWVISENIGNLLIFREKVLRLRPKSVCAVEMTMYVHWACINVNRKDVHTSMIFILQ